MKKNITYNILCLFSVFITAVLVFSGCERIRETFGISSTEETAAEVPVFAVNTTTAVKGQIQNYISFSGDIIPGSTVDTYSDAAGRIVQLHVSVGDRVVRGAPIATVDPSRPGMTYRHSVATAPIGGTIIALPAQMGMTVSQAVPLARISGGSGLEIKLNVAERFISKMAVNLSCEITLDAWPGEVFRGSISELSPTLDAASRTMEVRVIVRDADSKLKSGMFAKVRVVTESKEDIVKIPAAAMISRFGEQFVFLIEKDPNDPRFNIVRKRIIVPGINIDGVMEVQSGLSPDDEIVIRGQTLLDDGSRVNIIERIKTLDAD